MMLVVIDNSFFKADTILITTNVVCLNTLMKENNIETFEVNMRTVDDCIQDLIPALITHLVDEKLNTHDMFLLGQLSAAITKAGGLTVSNNIECEDSGDEQEEKFSLKHACHHLTYKLMNHSGELTRTERNNMLELIEYAAKVLRAY